MRRMQCVAKHELSSEDMSEIQSSTPPAADCQIVVDLTAAAGEKPERVTFKASEVLCHHQETRTWDEIASDPHQHLQMSLAEDYALWAFKRRFGDMEEYEVHVVSGLSVQTTCGENDQPTVRYVSAAEFAKNHRCDSDWIAAMGDKLVPVLYAGLSGTSSGYEATILQHYSNGMYEVRLPGGVACISGGAFEFAGKVTVDGVPKPAVSSHGVDLAGREPASWVIKEIATGKVIMETFERKVVEALNKDRYQGVPILDHLAGINAVLRAEESQHVRTVNTVAGGSEPHFRVWPDGTTQSSEDGDPYPWKSDDFLRVDAQSEEEALAIAGRIEQDAWNKRAAKTSDDVPENSLADPARPRQRM